ncbi:unnamed protein product [Periconia digitata]|uniref:Uncharacterized protein n=1 Tax=Periconia digitata TaxID=1303443 RepID=A0A9W4U931_9PLEO|nr:unnamed protein product [Periconia digitata]
MCINSSLISTFRSFSHLLRNRPHAYPDCCLPAQDLIHLSRGLYRLFLPLETQDTKRYFHHAKIQTVLIAGWNNAIRKTLPSSFNFSPESRISHENHSFLNRYPTSH